MFLGKDYQQQQQQQKPQTSTSCNNIMTFINEQECQHPPAAAGAVSILNHQLDHHQQQQDTQNGLNKQNTEGKDGDGGGGGDGPFGYSQKFFHISDGNLYSVFSPLQGRSYGVKPSFLRKHRCTVQETKNNNGLPPPGTTTGNKKANKRNQRKGLKFHNFIPSESITSERDEGRDRSNKDIQNGHGGKKTSSETGGRRSGTPTGEVWKVHAECRLREEHGTKQIMVSNWSLSSDSPAIPRNQPPPPSIKTNFKVLEESRSSGGAGPELLVAPKPHRENGGGTHMREIQPMEVTSESRKEETVANKPSVLQQYLEYGKMLPDSDLEDVEVKQELVVEDGKKRRRKPTTTRRVVPYNKYLSMVDKHEDAPLDLSCQQREDHFPVEMDHQDTKLGLYDPNEWTDCPRLIKSECPLPSTSYGGPTTNQKLLPPGFMSLSLQGQKGGSEIGNAMGRTIQFDSAGGSGSNREIAMGRTDQFGSRARRKPSQRTIIRQKLEDTFKQNGFLVKTKQVSDGDATFCKFKQLRKYTRYYLKSWHQHLPDEVHKLWKGFLPPKTPLNAAASSTTQGATPSTTAASHQEVTHNTQPQDEKNI